MQVQASTPESTSECTAIGPVSNLEIDQSCRAPVSLLFVKAAGWLVVGTLLGIIGSIKMHAPDFLAQCSILTYGKIRPAYLHILVYGFALQAALGIGLWMMSHLGRVRLVGGLLTTFATILWNVGVLVGTIGIFAGHNTGFEWLEYPRYATPILFFSFLTIGTALLLTYHARRERESFVSMWYIVAGVLWFAWIFSTGELLLKVFPVRGMVQEVVDRWYGHNLFTVALAALGLAASYYFVTKLSTRPLHSRPLALFAFWTLLLLGSWGGVATGAPVPRWIPSLGNALTVLLVVSVLAVAQNLYSTLKGEYARHSSNWVLKFIVFGFAGYVLASAIQIFGVMPHVGKAVNYTTYASGFTHLFLFGFLGMTFAGAIYFILPRITGTDWRSVGTVKLHFWLTVLGAVLITAGNVRGGIRLGTGMNNPDLPFVSVSRSAIPMMGISTLGMTILFLGSTVFLLSVLRLLADSCACCGAAVSKTKNSSKSKSGGGKP